MIDFRQEQERLYTLLREHGEKGFVRVCKEDDALWASDMVRRTADETAVMELLARNGYVCHTDREAGLWYLDWSPAEWRRQLETIECALPTFPENEELHPVYALCRFLSLHRAPVCTAGLRPVRRILKKMNEGEQLFLQAVPSIHEEAAALLRLGQPVPHQAGGLLTQWLRKERKQ